MRQVWRADVGLRKEARYLGGCFFKPRECGDRLLAVLATHLAIKLKLPAHRRASGMAKQLTQVVLA